MNILITGGAGFIASHIADACIELGHQVAIVDNMCTGHYEYVHPQAEFHKLDIADPQLTGVFEAFQPEVVIHHAAQIDVRSSISNPLLDANVNILGSIHLLELCKNYGVRKIIYASSAAVYGKPMALGICEDHPIRPLSGYGISKHTVEHYMDVYAHLFGLDYTILRYANVYGIRQDPKGEGGVISIFVDKWLRKNVPVIYGDGEQTRDFIYVKDIVRANLLALTKGSHAIVNIGTDSQTSINELSRIMNIIFEDSIVPTYHKTRPGDIERSCLNNRLAFKMLGWKPKYTLMQGLEEVCGYYKVNYPLPSINSIK